MILRALAYLSCLAFLSGVAFTQPTETKSTFEIADVHVSRPTRNPFMRGPMLRNGRYEIHFATMADLISKAYGMDKVRVLKGPKWLESDLFDVVAKAPEGTTADSAKPLLQTLLADRFKLVVHNDTKPLLAYGLKASKHPQLKEADGSGDTGCKFTPPAMPSGGGMPSSPPLLSYSCHNMTMTEFAEALHTTIALGAQYLNEKLVVDQTELKGKWNFDFKYSIKGMMLPGMDMSGTITLFDAMEKQLGLKLEPTEVPLPVIVVDSVNQKPSPNLPNIEETLHVPPAPTEFEVATLKATPPDFKGMRLQLPPGGRVNIAGTPVKFLIEQAWDLTDEMLVNAPKWMETDRYDIVAKADTASQQVDIDDLFPMLRSLLTERFKLVTHMEERPVNAYTLKAVKPKLKKAEPDSRTKCQEGPAADGKDPRDKNPVLGRLLTCSNMSMAEFSEKLKNLAPGYIHTPVLDSTGLDGGYDFTLSFSPAGLSNRPMPGGGQPNPTAADAAPTASDPNGAVTLFEAIEKQLGLKLEQQKRPVKILVIDHADQKPIEN